ncbi:uncharacterized protein K444DRAFT_649072 [Hyaloscypha bicolor E]|uniref:Uncharacterized protein n=1 Tax=Hyaloscypha bicolor E TaxID=1095630 RepID=A0A2J6SEF6_9HELO|nr:uncharacterized protein K444DRAFT_649072 [Hyaloscypha bicolor E]PMD49134.1 hypothetical protein K444DRAFT_649072 [Hyaloscypha bicolor E]
MGEISYGGSGCPQSSLSFIYTIIFNGYTSSMGTNISARENRKHCRINLNILYPTGIQYSPMSVGYSGYANFEDGVQGLHQTSYYFSGSFAGPTSAAYSFEEAIDPTGAVVWSPCNSPIPLNINNRVRLTGDSNSAGNGVLYDSGILDLTLQWKSC